MKNNTTILLSVSILAVTLLYASSVVAESLQNQSNQTIRVPELAFLSPNAYPAEAERGLLSADEAATYLSMSPNVLMGWMALEEIERNQLESYEAYTYIPYIEFDGTKYFSKDQLDKWIEYNTLKHTVRP